MKLIVIGLIVGAVAVGAGCAGHRHCQTSEAHSHGAVYSCPMHPEVRASQPGSCSKCGMDLVRQ